MATLLSNRPRTHAQEEAFRGLPPKGARWTSRSRSPLGRTVDALKNGTKRRKAATSRQVGSRDAAIDAVRKSVELRQSLPLSAEAPRRVEPLSLQVELHRLYQQAVLNDTMAGRSPPTLDAFIQSLHLQTPTPQVAHQNEAPQDPADTTIPGHHAPCSRGPSIQEGNRMGQE